MVGPARTMAVNHRFDRHFHVDDPRRAPLLDCEHDKILRNRPGGRIVVSQTLMTSRDAIGRDDVSGRDLFVVDVARLDDLIWPLPSASKYFVCLLAWDAASA
jgi:hypothetical protein